MPHVQFSHSLLWFLCAQCLYNSACLVTLLGCPKSQCNSACLSPRVSNVCTISPVFLSCLAATCVLLPVQLSFFCCCHCIKCVSSSQCHCVQRVYSSVFLVSLPLWPVSVLASLYCLQCDPVQCLHTNQVLFFPCHSVSSQYHSLTCLSLCWISVKSLDFRCPLVPSVCTTEQYCLFVPKVSTNISNLLCLQLCMLHVIHP